MDTRSPIDRRTFLYSGAIAGVVAVAGREPGEKESLGRSVDPRGSTPAVGQAELDEITVAELQKGMESGRYSARSVAELYLRRIEEVNTKGPALKSVIEVNPDAIAIAESLDNERRTRKEPRGPLHGIPVLIKDNIDTADNMRTSAGSLALAESIATRDAFIARRLREAGAVILGKTNLSEWANFRSTRSSSGWSGRGGQTRNPYALDRNPCGSSSGSGSAAAANLATLAIGTETDGSIVCPASACGLVGVKPTVGLVSRSGIIPISHSQDTAGPMTRTVADAAALLGAIAGFDPADSATTASRGRTEQDYTRFLDPAGLKGVRLGIARNFFGFNDRVDGIMSEAIAAMKNAGAVVVDPTNFPTRGQFDDSEFDVLLVEFKHGLNAYLANLGSPASARPKSLADLIEFNDRNAQREMPFFGQEIFLRAQKKGPLTSSAYKKALAKNHLLSRTRGIDALVAKHKLDAIVTPTGGPAWTTDLVNGDHFSGGSSTPAAVAGYPAITVPAGFVYGLPVGITFFGKAWTEPKLFRVAYAFEQATKVRKPPTFLATADLGGGASD